jgi:hypothetical protein
MIAEIIQLLKTDEFFGVSNEVEIAKGKRQLMTSFKQLKYQIRRWLKS